jgi:tRNA pseudouridine38-40 synthase
LTLFDPSSLSAGSEVRGVDPHDEAHCADPPAEAARDDQDDVCAKRTRLRLEVAYDGTRFRGFAEQQGQLTVGGELRRAISTVARHDVELVCAGRTDAGVHALGQVVHVDVHPDLEPARLAKAVNALLGPAVVVRDASRAPEGFDARRSATSRRYRYLVLNSQTPDPLLSATTWHVKDALELRAMSAAADSLLGEHDFSGFCRRPPGSPPGSPITRRVLDARWSRAQGPFEDTGPIPSSAGAGEGARVAGSLLRFDVTATSFCHQMVRSFVGMLVDVGRGRRKVSDVVDLLRAPDRSRANTLAPPHGLCLVAVEYGSGARVGYPRRSVGEALAPGDGAVPAAAGPGRSDSKSRQ